MFCHYHSTTECIFFRFQLDRCQMVLLSNHKKYPLLYRFSFILTNRDMMWWPKLHPNSLRGKKFSMPRFFPDFKCPFFCQSTTITHISLYHGFHNLINKLAQIHTQELLREKTSRHPLLLSFDPCLRLCFSCLCFSILTFCPASCVLGVSSHSTLHPLCTVSLALSLCCLSLFCFSQSFVPSSLVSHCFSRCVSFASQFQHCFLHDCVSVRDYPSTKMLTNRLLTSGYSVDVITTHWSRKLCCNSSISLTDVTCKPALSRLL